MVGYGGSYQNANAKVIFDRLARAGSCESPGDYYANVNPISYEGLDNKTGCESPIDAETPADLKTEISSKIRQIIAERLSFTAPSITATLEEGGSIYQAQFNYEQHGEWTGHLYRKAIVTNDDGSTEIKHETTYSDENGKNWDAGEQLKIIGSDNRNIWTVLDVDDGGSTNYIGNWNNNRIEGAGLLQLKGEDEVHDWHTQRFVRKNWPAGLRLPSLVNFIKDEIKEELGGGVKWSWEEKKYEGFSISKNIDDVFSNKNKGAIISFFNIQPILYLYGSSFTSIFCFFFNRFHRIYTGICYFLNITEKYIQ